MHVPERLHDLATKARKAKHWQWDDILNEIADDLDRIATYLERAGIGNVPEKKNDA